MFLKASNYLKTSPTRFPGAQSASLHPELPQGLLKVNSYSSMGLNLCRGRANAFVVKSLAILLLSVNYKLALNKSIANDLTTKAFALPLQRLSPMLL